MFALTLAERGDTVAIRCGDGGTHTFAELAVFADHVFGAEQAPRGERALIAIECANSLSSVSGYLGALRQGIPALLIDESLDTGLRERLYRHYRVSHVWTSAGEWARRDHTPPTVHPDVAIMLSTSGSTGDPKLVRLTRANLQANASSIARYLGLTAAERPITSLPIHYSYGLSVLNSHLLAGASVILTDESVTSQGFWRAFRDHEATSFAGVPTTYKLLKQMRFERMALPSLRTMTQAGGRLDPDLVRWYGALCAEHGRRFFVMYGQTEATARIAYVPPERLDEKVGSMGVAIPDGELWLEDEQHQPVTELGKTGELVYRGPNVMMGYANTAEDLALPDLNQGVLRTGDLAYRDADGFFFIVGRLKRFIKVFGNRIALDEVEIQLRAAGHDVVVTGEDERLVVVLEGAEADAATEEVLRNDVANRYRLHPSAIRVVTLAEVPRSSAGKVLYGALLEMAKGMVVA